MPNIYPAAKAWQMDVSGRFGEAVRRRRKALGISGERLAERTRELGYPISRPMITKIENNARAGKVDLCEALILARALSIAPVMLLFPEYPGENQAVEFLPGVGGYPVDAAQWATGKRPMPDETEMRRLSSDGERSEMLGEMVRQSQQLGEVPPNIKEAARLITQECEQLERELEAQRAAIWGDA